MEKKARWEKDRPAILRASFYWSGEGYFLRMLLMVVKGAQSYEDICTFQRIVHTTFKEACKWHHGFEEASTWGTSYQLRHLFVTRLVFCDINDMNVLFSRKFG